MVALSSLKVRIAATIFVLEAVMMAVVLWQVLGAVHESVGRQIDSQDQVTLELLKGLSLQALVTEEFADLQPYLEDLQQDQRIVRAVLSGRRGRVLAASDVADLGEDIATMQPRPDAYWRTRKIDGAGGHLGTLAIEFSNAPLNQARDRARNRGITIAVIGMVCIAIVGILTGWLLTRRLNRVQVAAQRMSDGDLGVRTRLSGRDEVAVLGSSFDLMAERIAEGQETLRLANLDLEHRVAQRTGELTASNTRLTEALSTLQHAQNQLVQMEKVAALGHLVAGVAHELNTPIGNGLLVATTFGETTRDLTRSDAVGSKHPVIEKYLDDAGKMMDMLVGELERAATIIASFKQLAVDQAGSRRRTFDLAQIVAENVMALDLNFRARGLRIEQDIPDGIELDSFPGPLGQVLVNLVDNAMVHGFAERDSGLVRITIGRVDADSVQLQVSDDGRGISPENLQRIYDPFYTTRLGQGNSGLGLNIVHNIVGGMLGGRIEVSSELGRGTTFVLTLPLKAPDSDIAD